MAVDTLVRDWDDSLELVNSVWPAIANTSECHGLSTDDHFRQHDPFVPCCRD